MTPPAASEPSETPAERAEENRGFLSLERIIFLSDAVFAIAMTLLVIDLRVPEGSDATFDKIWALWPKILSYAVSFAVIGLYWLAHWRRFVSGAYDTSPDRYEIAVLGGASDVRVGTL